MTAEQMSNMSNTEKKLDVICLGAAVVDIPLRPVSRDIFDIESYPVDRIAMSVGGDAMNEATIISRLGFKTGIIACIGDDAAGQFILRSCEKDNIDVEGIKIDPTIDTSMNIGLVTDDGERTFVTNRNGSLWKENIEHVDFEKMKQAKILSLASIFNCPLLDGKTLVKIFKEAKAAGVDAFIAKPLFRSRLTATLRQFTSGRKENTARNDLEKLSEADYTGKRILLVDDNELNREIGVEILRMTGAEVETAENGKIAVEKVEASPEGSYDLIFMDIQMPVMNGYEATAAIRSLPGEKGKVPIVAMTANAFAEDVQLAKNTGMNGHIAKPLDMNKLKDVLGNCL